MTHCLRSRPLAKRSLRISKHFWFADLVECGEAYSANQVRNDPLQSETIQAMKATAELILDPVVEKCGKCTLTSGLRTIALLKHIKRRIAPRYDQHSAHELNGRGSRICLRDGFAVDFFISGIGSLTVAQFIARNLPFDRLYFYDNSRPLHVSYGPDRLRKICLMSYRAYHDRWCPINIAPEKFLTLK